MPRQAVTQKQLLRIEGLNVVLKNIEATLDRVAAKQLKAIYVEAAKPLWSQVKSNISALPVSDRLKKVLDAQMMINQADPQRQYVISGMSQRAGAKRLGKSSFVVNPYWIEFGTAVRHARGRVTGSIKAFPFFRPALSMVKSAIKQTLVSGLLKQISKGLPEK